MSSSTPPGGSERDEGQRPESGSPPGSQPSSPPGESGASPPPGGAGGGGEGRGSQPPPPPGGSGGPPSAGGGPAGQGPSFQIGDAFNYGWQKFQQNIGAILLGALAYLVGAAVLGAIWFFITGAIAGGFGDTNAGFFALLVSTAVSSLGFVVLGVIIQAGITRGALAITYGEDITMETLFSFDNLGQIVLAGIIVAVASSVGYLLCFIPGLIVAFFTQFAVHFIIDKGLPAVEALRQSFSFVNQHLATLIGFFIAVMIANMIGSLLCGIGLLVSVPVAIIAQAYAYRKLQGEAVAA